MAKVSLAPVFEKSIFPYYYIRMFEYWNYEMPSRALISQEMAGFLSAISHAHRIRIIEELHSGEKDVNTMSAILEINHSSVSQHLSILRANNVVTQRKEGNRVFYRLTQPELAEWLLQGLVFLERGLKSAQEIRMAADEVKKLWGHTEDSEDPQHK